jgi:outer membrane immunogenic protein
MVADWSRYGEHSTALREETAKAQISKFSNRMVAQGHLPSRAWSDEMTKRVITVLVLALQPCLGSAEDKIASNSASAPPPPIWTGFYAGVNAGGFWNSASAPATVDWASLTSPGRLSVPTNFASVPQGDVTWSTGPGFVGGGQVGYSWQVTDKVVLGVETDFQGMAGRGNGWDTGWMSGSSSSKGPGSIESVRGRAGYLVAPNLQLYGTGGFSYSGN